ncbi:MAG: hypothetical protein KF724_05140 [Phycisphaeraceae bacterium]|nr:hypothetical protein [Phycisphaeraceae bacterium]
MSLHSSLKTASGALNRHRNVLTRTERIEKLVLAEKLDLEKGSALGLVKVRSIKASTGKKPKKAEGEGGDAAAAAPAAGKAGASAAGGKAAAPAKDAGAKKK